MAFLDPAVLAHGHGLRACGAELDARSETLSPLQRQVIYLACHDPRSSVRNDGVLARWLDRLGQRPRATPLADPQLEALRHLAVLIRDGQDESKKGRQLALLAGMSPTQIAEARELVPHSASAPVPARSELPTVIVAFAASGGAYATIQSHISDLLPALVGAGICAAFAASLFRPHQRSGPQTAPDCA